MCRQSWAVLVLLATWSAPAAEPKPNTLTTREITEGWLLLFDGESTFGWHVDGEATVENGVLKLGGKETTLSTTSAFSAYTLRVEFRKPSADASITLNGQRWKFLNWGGGRWEKFVDAAGWIAIEWTIRPGSHGQSHSLQGKYGTGPSALPFGTGPSLTGTISPLRFSIPAGDALALRSIKLKPLTLQSLFNGKDLAGWKEFPGRKSKFSVTPEGWLNVKDGPGDLQTEGQWSDFVLQLDCISHGSHLNSGVFFRCRPGEYQQGYEAQVRNQFTAEPTQDYTLDDYDPKTHELVGKRKIKSTAVDYGTGAIYRRMPARKQMSRDREWFTMTVVAHGRHLAVWVNGVQVTDWTDQRPAADNARNGYRQAKGPISLQGHDPTTDLSFRNLRIAELPAASAMK